MGDVTRPLRASNALEPQVMPLVAIQPADKLLSLQGLYERYDIDQELQILLEERILEKYEKTPH